MEKGRGPRSGNRSHVTTKHTMSTSRGDDLEVDSQDSILGDDHIKSSHSDIHGGSQRTGKDGRIVRTDVVTVTYDTDSVDGRRRAPEEPERSWVRM